MRAKLNCGVPIWSAALLAMPFILALSGCSGMSLRLRCAAKAPGGRSRPGGAAGRFDLPAMDRYARRYGQRDDQSAGHGISADSQNYTEEIVRKEGPVASSRIDSRPFQAALEQAQGQLSQANGQLAQAKAQLVQSQAQVAQAQANQHRTQLDVNRYTPLAAQQAVTAQDLDNATQNNLSAQAAGGGRKRSVRKRLQAQIQAARARQRTLPKAAVDAARVNSGSPGSLRRSTGSQGKAQVQVGNLVGTAGGAITIVSTP